MTAPVRSPSRLIDDETRQALRVLALAAAASAALVGLAHAAAAYL